MLETFSQKNITPAPRISIITVVRNDANSIKKTLSSVIEQDYVFKEYIIIDGASTDGTLGIINDYKNKIDITITEPDRGIYDAMNKGLKLSSGDLVLFLNSGDYLANNEVLSYVAKVFQENPDTALIFGSIILNYSKLRIQKKISRDFSKKKLIWGQQPPHPATFFKKSILVELGGFNTLFSYSADFDLFCRLIKKNHRYININMPVSFFHSGGSSAKLSAKIETFNIIKKYFMFHHAIRYMVIKVAETMMKSVLDATGILGLFHRIKKFYITQL